MEVGATQGRNHAPRIALLNVKERIPVKQVYSPYLHAGAFGAPVDGIDDVAGKEAVALARTHIDARHARLGAPPVFILLAVCAAPLAPLVTIGIALDVFSLRRALIRQVKHRRVFVVRYQPVHLH